MGVPFFGFSFVTLFFMLIFLDEINPGWTFVNYLSIMLASWAISFILAFLIKTGVTKKLIIDAGEKKIKEITSTFFIPFRAVYDFSDIRTVNLHRDAWHVTNTLRNPILYLNTTDNKSIFIRFRHRDIQPAKKEYLAAIKTRIEYMLCDPRGIIPADSQGNGARCNLGERKTKSVDGSVLPVVPSKITEHISYVAG